MSLSTPPAKWTGYPLYTYAKFDSKMFIVAPSSAISQNETTVWMDWTPKIIDISFEYQSQFEVDWSHSSDNANNHNFSDKYFKSRSQVQMDLTDNDKLG